MNLDNEFSSTIFLSNNYFILNKGFYSGSCIYLLNQLNKTLIQMKSNFFSQNSIQESGEIIGSTIHLINPYNISLENNIFVNNSGRSGGCIYYEEKFTHFIFNLEKNYFVSNLADLGGGGLYLADKYQKISLNKNVFKDNIADYGNDYTTKPFRVGLYLNSTNKLSFDRSKMYIYSIVPGISNLNLKFHVLDYFDQKILHLNGTATLQLKNPLNSGWTDLSGTTFVKIEGLTSASIQQGFFYSLIFNFNQKR